MTTKKKPDRRKVKLGLEIEPELRERMDMLKDKDGISYTAMVNQALRRYLWTVDDGK